VTARTYIARLMLNEQDEHPGRKPLVFVDLDQPVQAAAKLDGLMATMAADRGCDLTPRHYLALKPAGGGEEQHWYRGGGL